MKKQPKLSTENVTIDRNGIVRLNLKSQKVQRKIWNVISTFKDFKIERESSTRLTGRSC